MKIDVVGKEREIQKFLRYSTTLKNLPSKLLGLTSLEPRPESYLSKLTLKQRQAMITAYGLGYYDVPRRVSSEEVSRHLEIDKSTFVEHLRKAERKLVCIIIYSHVNEVTCIIIQPLKGGIFRNSKIYFVLALITVAMLHTGYLSTINLSAQTMSMGNSTTTQQHEEHTFDNLIISENIPLTGQLTNRDHLLLMDFTPFATSVEGHSHIATKVSCSEDRSPKITIVTGIAPRLNTLHVGNAINNGTLMGSI
jgi:DNA-binding CsgD family transcriptional regulator